MMWAKTLMIQELADAQWEEIQVPIREEISRYANQVINSEEWQGGSNVTRENGHKFAIDILLHVRSQFYAHHSASANRLSNHTDNRASHILVLENMKWVYDTLVKPHTEKYRKELFLCNGCDAGKLYALEGVIQHYAAKHTNSLSSGSIVVHWKAEWPEEPPFNPNPAAAVAVQYNPPPDYGRSGAYNPDPAGHYYNQGGYQHNPPPPEQYQQPYPAGYPSHTEYQDSYYTQQPEQYHAPPPDPYQQAHQGYPAPEQYGPPPPGAYSYPNGPSYSNGQLYPPSEHYPPGPYTGQYPPTNPYEAPAQYPPQGGAQPPAAQGYYDQTQQYSYGYPPAQYPPSNYYAPETQYAQQEDVQAYKAQLEHIAHNARDLWGKTAGVKDLPGSVRVQTIIHHLIQRSRASFPTDPPLTMLIDGLSNNKEMRPVRNVNELTCKTCSIAAEVDYQSSGTPSVKKFFSLPQLLNHFQSTHISAPQAISQQDAQADQPDWTTDMVELPDLASIARLTRAPGMDSSKLRLIEEALPEAFKPAPAPRQVQPQRRRHEQTDKRGSRRRDASYSRYQDRDRPFIKSEKPSSIDYEYSSRDSTEARFYDDRPYLPAEATDNRERAQSRQDYDRFYDEPHPVDVKMQEGRQKPRRSSTPHRETRAIYQRDESRVLPSKAQTRVEEYTGQRPLSRSKNLARHIEQMSKLAANPTPDTRAVSVRPEPTQVMSAPAAIADTAERLLSDFQPGGSDTIHESIQPMTASEVDSRIDDLRDRRRLDVTEDMRRIQSTPRDYSPQRLRQYEPDRMGTGSIRLESPAGPTSREHATSSRPSYAYEYDDRYETPGPVPVVLRGRSPELVDHRYKVNNVVVHRDERERQGSHGPRRTPSRWARYESVRIEQERARSRSPVYVRVGPQASQYRDRSPQRQPELLYRPQHEQVEGITYERIPRQEYYRVYAEVPHPRRVKYEERVEYVQIPDRPGEYYIRRPARPEPEPIYISYDERPYTEQPLVERSETREIRPMVTRADPAYYEEYDPRHPEPPPSAPTGTTPRSAQYKR